MSDSNKKGKLHWRSLDELADTKEFKEFLHREFPQGASEMNNDWSRRNFLTLMGASLALAGLAGCRRPEQNIVPYVKPPEEIVPGIPQYYATTMPFAGSAYGLVVESHEGRPTKIEGNEKHPSTLGASNAWIQASILGLYDPDRSQHVLNEGAEKTWDDFVTFWRDHTPKYADNKGEGLAVLTESFSSPTMVRLKKQFEKKYPGASWVTYDPISDENMYEGIKIVTGDVFRPVYDLSKADVVVSLDCDFLHTESENISASRGFMDRRRLESEKDSMNRLYMLEAGFSVTGAAADHRMIVDGRDIGFFAAYLVRFLRSKGLSLPALDYVEEYDIEKGSWLDVMADDLLAAGNKAVILVGSGQPPAVHAMAYALNAALGSVGTCVNLYRPGSGSISSMKGLTELSGEMREGKISTLLMLGGNPGFNAPVDVSFAEALGKVETSVHISLYNDETSQASTWHVPQAHYLESWSDATAANGVASVIQPMIAPLFNGVGTVEFINLIAAGGNTPDYDIVRNTWQTILPRKNFEDEWRKLLHDGVHEAAAGRQSKPGIKTSSVVMAVNEMLDSRRFAKKPELDIAFKVSPSLYDGRFANNGWLQELPHPITKLTWDNAALVSPKTAAELDVKNEDMVKLTYRERELEMPIWIVPGIADNTVILELGYGQKNLGRVADGVGFNTYSLRTSEAPYYDTGLKLEKTGKTYELSCTQDHGSMEGRPHVREATLGQYREHPNFAPEAVHHPPLVSMWEDHKYDKGYQWGMAIDLTSCIGCNACTIACQSENNIPVVGKEQVGNGREMHWIRVDRYFTGDVKRPTAVHQPVACQHCEMAPCEQVCPVAATVHDDEGLNTMVYNRCVGTRYCSNNCPYKVRRFNFFNFTKDTPEVTKMVHNPDVTVRSRGVMEKCTYCIQRINRVRIEAKKDERSIADGEITTACQQACPTGAIMFGNVNDPESKVSKVKARNRNYDLLGELNIRPRTSYLAKIRNPNPNTPDEG